MCVFIQGRSELEISCLWDIVNVRKRQPIVKVGLEALDLNDQDDLVKGAELLAKIDPAVVVSNEANGQLILSAMGEVHLQFLFPYLQMLNNYC